MNFRAAPFRCTTPFSEASRAFRLFFLSGLFIYSSTLILTAQDTLRVTLPRADSIFLAKNLLLLAQQYDIKSSEALILQARAYPNPIFTADVNMLDPQHNEVFHVNGTGQKAFSVEQLIVLGGKRRTGIEIAKKNKAVAEYEFSDLLRNLQSELRSSFLELYQQRTMLENYHRQLQLLDTLIQSYDLQAKRGNVPLKDAIRLKSVYLKINNENAALASDHTERLKKIQLLLGISGYVFPLIDDRYFDTFTLAKPYDELVRLAMDNRPDLKIAEGQAELSALDLRLQRQLAIPDIAANASYDQRGGAFNNQVNAGISIPLPLWNRNRGNKKSAEFALQSSLAYQQHAKMVVQTDVLGAWQNLTRSIGEYTKIKGIYTDDFDQVFRGININFRRQNITILEFVDFFEAYNESLTEFARVKTQLAIAAGQINFVTGSQLY